jgi:hypothetical protein
MSAQSLFDDVIAMQKDGLKPFVIVRRVLTAAEPNEVALRGTVNDSQLVFRTGEVISFDGREWRYSPAAAPAASQGRRGG